MGEIIQFRPVETVSEEDEWLDVENWQGSDWKEFFETMVTRMAEKSGNDPWDMFAEILHVMMFGND